MVLTLLSVRWLFIRNALLRSTPQERKRARAGLLASAFIVGGIGWISYAFFDPFVALSFNDSAMQVVLARLPAFAFFSAFWMLLLSAVTVGIQTFYLNHELGLLLSAPVSPRAIFGAKFVEGTVANATLFLTIGAPVLMAYSFARGYITPPYIIYLTLVLVAFAALPTCLGILFSFLLMRVLPANRTRDLLAAIGIALFATLYFVMSVSVKRVSDMAALRHGTASLATLMDQPIFQKGPWAWAGEVLNSNPLYTTTDLWTRIGLLWLVAAGTILLTAWVAQWLHWRGWTTAQESALSGSTATPVGNGWEQRLSRLPGPMRAVFLKDLRSLRRDMRQLSMLFIPIAVIAVFLFNVTQTPQFRRIEPVLFIQTLLLILAPISLRLAMSGFVTENRAVWLMLTAPNDPAAILGGKFLYAYALSLPLAAAATGFYGLLTQMSPGQSFVSAALMLCAVAGFCGIGVGASAFFADFSAGDPRFTISTGGRLVTFGVQLGYLALLVAVTLTAWALNRAMNLAPVPIYLAAGALVTALSVGFVAAPLALGARRLRRLEW